MKISMLKIGIITCFIGISFFGFKFYQDYSIEKCVENQTIIFEQLQKDYKSSKSVMKKAEIQMKGIAQAKIVDDLRDATFEQKKEFCLK